MGSQGSKATGDAGLNGYMTGRLAWVGRAGKRIRGQHCPLHKDGTHAASRLIERQWCCCSGFSTEQQVARPRSWHRSNAKSVRGGRARSKTIATVEVAAASGAKAPRRLEARPPKALAPVLITIRGPPAHPQLRCSPNRLSAAGFPRTGLRNVVSSNMLGYVAIWLSERSRYAPEGHGKEGHDFR